MRIGSARITGSGYIDSTNPTRIFALIVKSTGTAAVITAGNANTTEYDSITGTASTGAIRGYPGGLLFPGGCYVTFDGNTSYVTALYVREPN